MDDIVEMAIKFALYAIVSFWAGKLFYSVLTGARPLIKKYNPPHG